MVSKAQGSMRECVLGLWGIYSDMRKGITPSAEEFHERLIAVYRPIFRGAYVTVNKEKKKKGYISFNLGGSFDQVSISDSPSLGFFDQIRIEPSDLGLFRDFMGEFRQTVKKRAGCAFRLSGRYHEIVSHDEVGSRPENQIFDTGLYEMDNPSFFWDGPGCLLVKQYSSKPNSNQDDDNLGAEVRLFKDPSQVFVKNASSILVEPVNDFGEYLLDIEPTEAMPGLVFLFNHGEMRTIAQLLRATVAMFQFAHGGLDRLGVCKNCGRLFIVDLRIGVDLCSKKCAEASSPLSTPSDINKCANCRRNQNNWAKRHMGKVRQAKAEIVRISHCRACNKPTNIGQCQTVRKLNPKIAEWYDKNMKR